MKKKYKVKLFNTKHKSAFTLAEVLITLGIIGVVAAMTMPTLINSTQDLQFKTAYKKAFADLSQTIQEAMFNQEYFRAAKFDNAATAAEMQVFKDKFKLVLDCSEGSIDACWATSDSVCGGSCFSGNDDDGVDLANGAPSSTIGSTCFVDASGRNWCSFSSSENLYIVDTNGFKGPNRFGKDRWLFTFGDREGERANNSIDYRKIIPYVDWDMTEQDNWCKYPPCYYHSWLYK